MHPPKLIGCMRVAAPSFPPISRPGGDHGRRPGVLLVATPDDRRVRVLRPRAAVHRAGRRPVGGADGRRGSGCGVGQLRVVDEVAPAAPAAGAAAVRRDGAVAAAAAPVALPDHVDHERDQTFHLSSWISRVGGSPS
jgi:hypothetical protein